MTRAHEAGAGDAMKKQKRTQKDAEPKKDYLVEVESWTGTPNNRAFVCPGCRAVLLVPSTHYCPQGNTR